MSLPRYPEYKDSGVEWLGSLPSHWEVGSLKRRFEVCLGKMLQTDSSAETDSLKPYLRAANIQWDGVDITDIKSMWFSPRDIKQLQLESGDLLISEGGDVGRSAVWGDELNECYIQNSVNRVRARVDDSTWFLYYWMATIKAKGYVDVLCNKSTIAHFTAEKVAEVPTPFPPPAEQTAIATFLNRETGKIDALIAEQEKLLALLAEKRQATISHAVTKGLNPDAPMKESGVAWLGEVPEHWTLPPLYLRYSSELGKMLDAGRITSSHLVPYLRNVDVQWDAINFSDLPTMDIESSEYERYTVRKGDLLVCEGGEVGRAAVVRHIEEVIGYQKALHRLRALSDSEHPRYLFYTFAWASKTGVFSGEGQATIAHLTGEQLRKYRFPKPPKMEQQAIAAFLDAETAKLDALKTESEHAITLLKERRSALIAAAVTGQIDVRGLVTEPEAA